ncbi:MAG: hypothetical protein DMF76_05170 [Acidobacteria bacterium]|nr:MAG: hypothetical protein DMF76_05170 [Acidobacteriota bacterium]
MLMTLLLLAAPISDYSQERLKEIIPGPAVKELVSESLDHNPDGISPSSLPGQVWFDDSVPQDSSEHAEGGDGWFWVTANPVAISGGKSHQSRNFGQLDSSKTTHRHYFEDTLNELVLDPGDKLFTYVFLDINNMPGEIMLEWRDARSFEHRAYWGQNNIGLGIDGTSSRYYVGPLPKANTWVRLEVPAKAVGLEEASLNGMSFDLDAGRATFDAAGKLAATELPPPATPSGDSVWIEDGLPAGAKTATVNDVWKWVENLSPFGLLAHESFVSVTHNTTVYRSHSFTGAQTPMQVNPGDVLFTYVWMDPSAKPDQIMLQWNDGISWEHRAFWGENYIGRQVTNIGAQGTESQRYVGGLPPAGTWYRLEVPASYVGLEGKAVSGMAFSIYGKEPTVVWDRSGKTSRSSGVPLPLSATTSIWRLKTDDGYYAYDANDQGPATYFPDKKNAFFAYPNQAPGTVPFYRFRRSDSTNPELFYSQSKVYDGNGWRLDGAAFYVYADATTTGTLPLYLYHDAQFHYFLTINQTEATNMSLDGIAAYVLPPKEAVPTSPSGLTIAGRGALVVWRDTSDNETGFQIERNDGGWIVVANVAANITHYAPQSGAPPCGHVEYRVRAVNELGFSNSVQGEYDCTRIGSQPDSQALVLRITGPRNDDSMRGSFEMVAEPSDLGAIAKVEFFANGIKLGEVTSAPYVFVWNDVPPGTYNLTTTVTDAAGASTTSATITGTVGQTMPPPTPKLTLTPASSRSRVERGERAVPQRISRPRKYQKD